MNILVYTKRGCPWCEDLLSYLREEKIPFEEREVRGNESYFKEMKDLSFQEKAPTVVIDGVVYADTDKEAIKNILKKNNIKQ